MTIHVQIIEGDGEPAFVVIPHAEWRRVHAIVAAAETIMQSDEALYDAANRAAAGRPTVPLAALKDEAAGMPIVKVLRQARGLTQAQLAKAAGLSQAFLAQIEAGRRQPGLDTLRALAAALNTDPTVLLPPTS